MNGRERIFTALSHAEPDRVPYDLAGTHVTGIAIGAHDRWRDHLSLPKRETEIVDLLQQLAMPADDMLEMLKVDTRGLYPLCYNNLPLPVGSAMPSTWSTSKRTTPTWQPIMPASKRGYGSSSTWREATGGYGGCWSYASTSRRMW